MIRTGLYRAYDSAGHLPYVGISKSPEKRWAQHSRLQPWWPQVARREVAWHDTRTAAVTAEAAAIRDERPARNLHIPAPDGRFGMPLVTGGRPATGQTPVHNVRLVL